MFRHAPVHGVFFNAGAECTDIPEKMEGETDICLVERYWIAG